MLTLAARALPLLLLLCGCHKLLSFGPSSGDTVPVDDLAREPDAVGADRGPGGDLGPVADLPASDAPQVDGPAAPDQSPDVVGSDQLVLPHGTVDTVAGSGQSGCGDDSLLAAQFGGPYGIAIDSTGEKIYVSDYSCHTVRLVDLQAGTVSTIAGTPDADGFVDDPPGPAKFNYPRMIDVDSAGNVYVADSLNHAVRKIHSSGQVTTLAGIGPNQPGFVDGQLGIGQLSTPKSVFVAQSGEILVADNDNNAIRLIGGSGLSTVVSKNTGGPTPQITAPLGSPYQMDQDAAGTLYVADTGKDNVLVIDLYANSAAPLPANLPIEHPRGLAVNKAGDRVYVADYNARQIFEISNGQVTVLAGIYQQPGYADGDGSTAQFDNPYGLALAPDEKTLYVADRGNHVIRSIALQP